MPSLGKSVFRVAGAVLNEQTGKIVKTVGSKPAARTTAAAMNQRKGVTHFTPLFRDGEDWTFSDGSIFTPKGKAK